MGIAPGSPDEEAARPPAAHVDRGPRYLILDAALSVFAVDGPKGATIDQIATSAGLARAQIYDVFPSKEVSGWSAPADKQKAALDLAYRDVRDAFEHYMANFNHGRRFVLIGHSQGSIHLERLVREELDNDRRLRRQFISGLLIGGTVQTRPGSDVGGSFKHGPSAG